jgi:hypothetical protein
MSRFVIACVLAAWSAFLAPSAAAHSIVVDGDPSEWFGVPTSTPDLARVQRDVGRRGEWLWRDAAGDVRAGGPAALDLVELRLTADLTALSVLARLGAGVAVGGEGAPQLQLALDLDRFPGSGAGDFVAGAATQLASDAYWERLVRTRFGSGGAPAVHEPSGAWSPAGSAVCTPLGVVELRVPWSALGLPGPPEGPVRVSAALFVGRADDSVAVIQAPGVSQAADVVTHYGDPGRTDSTGTEVADGVLDHACDVWFDGDGDVIAPLTVSELYFADGTNSHWIEVYCAARAPVALQRFRLGDAEWPDSGGNEAMAQFPAVVLAPGQDFVVARRGATYLSDRGVRADAECIASDAGTPDMLPDPAWSPQVAFLFPGGGDECLLVEVGGTVVDVAVFGVGQWPGVTGAGTVASLHSLERAAPDDDRDDCALDFTDQGTPSPGNTPAAALAVAAPGAGLALSASRPNPARQRVAWDLRLSRPGWVEATVHDAAGRVVRTLERRDAAAGTHALQWDGHDTGGHRAAPGLYLVRVRTGEGVRTARAVWMP